MKLLYVESDRDALNLDRVLTVRWEYRERDRWEVTFLMDCDRAQAPWMATGTFRRDLTNEEMRAFVQDYCPTAYEGVNLTCMGYGGYNG